MAWFVLLLAIVLEVAGTTSMKLSEGFTKLTPSIAMGVFYVSSLVALTFVLKKLEVSTAYAVWSGVGTALVAGIGIFWFNEPATVAKVVCVALIIVGVVGLNLSSQAH
jgi:small multidrug resistance pump